MALFARVKEAKVKTIFEFFKPRSGKAEARKREREVARQVKD